MKKEERQHLARIRKSRGHSFERDIVKRFRDVGWWAYRTGGNSAYLPDVMATNDVKGELAVIEAKSGGKDHLYVKWDQISHDIFLMDGFKRYPVRNMVLAFKFISKKRNSKKEYERRKLKEYFKLFPEEFYKKLEGKNMSCHYVRGCPELPDYVPPFQIKGRSS